MSYGINIKNSNSEIQIDGEFQNMVVSATGNLAYENYIDTTGHPRYYSFYVQSILGGQNDSRLVFFKLNQGHRIGGWTLPSGASPLAPTSGSWTNRGYFATSSQSSLDYIVLDQAKNVSPSHTYGMEVYDASGNRTWHEGTKLLPQYLDFISVTPFSAYNAGMSAGSCSSGDLWVAMDYKYPGLFFPGQLGLHPTFLLKVMLNRDTSNNLTLTHISVGTLPPMGPAGGPTPTNFLYIQ